MFAFLVLFGNVLLQDVHEFFQVLSSTLEDELVSIVDVSQLCGSTPHCFLKFVSFI